MAWKRSSDKRQDEDQREDDRRQNRADVDREVGEVALEGLFGHADEGRGGLGGRERGDRDGPHGHVAAGEEVVLGGDLGLAGEVDAGGGEDREIESQHEPVERGESGGEDG